MEYRNLSDNIYQETFNDRAQGILNWIKENRDKFDWAKDPNAYEMTNVFLLGAKYAQEGVDINKETLKEMWNIRSKDFANSGISEQNFVYKICEDAYLASQEGRALVNDEGSHHALRKMAGIGLYLNQQKSNGRNIEYNNPQEFLEFLEASKTLKLVHPDLFEKYGFKENIAVIERLQPENALSNKIQKTFDDIFLEKRTNTKVKENNNLKEGQEDR